MASSLRGLTDKELSNVLKATIELELDAAFIALLKSELSAAGSTLINERNVVMGKQLLATTTVGDTQYQLYSVQILFPATFKDYRGTLVHQDVSIATYGIISIRFIGQEVIHYDSGSLSAHAFQVKKLFQFLYRHAINDIEVQREIIWKERESWCWNKYGNPFGKVANRKLRRQIKKWLH